MKKGLSRKLSYKTQMSRYLSQLSGLAGKSVEESDLGSIEELDELKPKLKKFIGQEKILFEIELKDIRSDRFRHFLKSLERMNHLPVFVWIERTNVCGTFRLPSISRINTEFTVELIPEGIVSFVTEDLEDRLVFDFDDNWVEIAIQGADWINVKY